MEYNQEISQEHRGLFIIAIDQSGSMLEPFSNHSMIVSKSDIAAMIASGIIEELVLHTKQAFRLSDPCPYCDICAIGYSKLDIEPLLPADTLILPITALNGELVPVVNRTIEYIDDQNRLQLVTESYREWIIPKASNITPAADMLNTANKIVSEWCNNISNRDSMPPIIFNISDGVCYQEYHNQYVELSNKIESMGTNHGKTLLINICVEACKENRLPMFPNPDEVPIQHMISPFAQMSSPLPEQFYPLAQKYNPNAKPPYLSFCYNAIAMHILPMLNIVVKWDNWELE